MSDLIRRIQRWHRDRCAQCGHRFHWKRDARHSHGNNDGQVWHGPCMAYEIWRAKADERLAVLALTLDVTGATADDIRTAAEFRADSALERSDAFNRAWRVFHDLETKAKP